MEVPIRILYEDEHLLVVSKPPGVLSVPDVPRKMERQGQRVLPVHRLDREVSGALVLARDDGTRQSLEALFRERLVRKTYWALARGRLEPAAGSFTFPLLEEGGSVRVSALGKRSLTRYRTLTDLGLATEVEIELVTGRTNQIRVHFAHAGHALIGERKFARGKDSPVHVRSRRVALHAWRIALPHPVTGAEVAVEAPLPEDLLELRERAGSRPPGRSLGG